MHLNRIFFIFILAFGLFVTGASAQTTGKNPVIIIPGVTGSELVNPATGKTVWFGVRRDKDDDIRLPMTSAILRNNRDTLIVKDIIRSIELPVLPDVEVYQALINALIERGYTEGNWNKPQAADVFYIFPYDWRRDNVEAAHLLVRKISETKLKLKLPNLRFDILAHSMGGLIARYAAMYGSADLPRRGVKPVPTWAGAAHINKLMMFGTPNEGSFSALDALINGYPIVASRKLPFIDDFRAEDVMTQPSAFQLLPHESSAKYLDENLQPLKVDIYDVNTWIKYGWGAISDPKFLGKLKDSNRLALKNKEIKTEELIKSSNRDDRLLAQTTFAQVKAYWASALDRAKRFHLALDVATKPSSVQIYAYGGNCAQTLDAVVILREEKKDQWKTLLDARDIKTANGSEFKKEEVKLAMFAVGDGRVTKRSLLAESALPGNGEAAYRIPLMASFLACGSHTKLFLEKEIQDSFMSALIVEKKEQP